MTSEEHRLMMMLAEDYQNLRILEDGTIVGTMKLLYTHALVIDLNSTGYERRYCYPDKALAVKASEELKSRDDEPIEGYVAKR